MAPLRTSIAPGDLGHITDHERIHLRLESAWAQAEDPDFGAVGDNSTDCTDPLNSFFAAVQGSYGFGKMGVGVFLCLGALVAASEGRSQALRLSGASKILTVIDSQAADGAALSLDGAFGPTLAADMTASLGDTTVNLSRALGPNVVVGNKLRIDGEYMLLTAYTPGALTCTVTRQYATGGETPLLQVHTSGAQIRINYAFAWDGCVENLSLMAISAPGANCVGLLVRAQWHLEINHVQIYGFTSDGWQTIASASDGDSTQFVDTKHCDIWFNDGHGVNHVDEGTFVGSGLFFLHNTLIQGNGKCGWRMHGLQLGMMGGTVASNVEAGVQLPYTNGGASQHCFTHHVEYDGNGTNGTSAHLELLSIVHFRSEMCRFNMRSGEATIAVRFGNHSVSGAVYVTILDPEIRATSGTHTTFLIEDVASRVTIKHPNWINGVVGVTKYQIDPLCYAIDIEDEDGQFLLHGGDRWVELDWNAGAAYYPNLVPTGVAAVNPGGPRHRINFLSDHTFTLGRPSPGSASPGQTFVLQLVNSSGGALTGITTYDGGTGKFTLDPVGNVFKSVPVAPPLDGFHITGVFVRRNNPSTPPSGIDVFEQIGDWTAPVAN